VGLSYDGKIITGWAALAKDEDQVPGLIDRPSGGQQTAP
jgi:hypothetical protein